MEGWEGLREADTSTLPVDQKANDLDTNFVRCFSTEAG